MHLLMQWQLVPVGIAYAVQPVTMGHGGYAALDWQNHLGQGHLPILQGGGAAESQGSGGGAATPAAARVITEAQAQAAVLTLTTDGAGSKLRFDDLAKRLQAASEGQLLALAHALGRAEPGEYED